MLTVSCLGFGWGNEGGCRYDLFLCQELLLSAQAAAGQHNQLVWRGSVPVVSLPEHLHAEVQRLQDWPGV